MLDTLKRYASGWIAQLFIALLVLSFAVWGVSDIFTGFRGNAVAQVGSTDITIVDFQRDYDLAVQNLTRQLGTPITQQQAAQMGIPAQVLGRLVNQATLDEAAANFGLGLSNEALSQKIMTDPQFVGPSGTFDRNYLAQLINARGFTEDQFIVAVRREYVRSQIGQAFAGGIATPEAYLRAMHEFRNEARDISYVVLNAPPESEISEPGETELAAWFETRKADWTAPEYRAITYFTLSPVDIARPEDVTDEDARERYDRSPQRFSTVERRQIQQIVFPDRAEADAAAAALAGGQLFDELLAARNLAASDVDLGLVTREQLADPALADAAFALASGAISPVIEGRFGPVIVRVTTVEPAVVTPFEDVVATLKTEIANERAVAEINGLHDAIEDARAGGDTISEVAAKYGLAVSTVSAVDDTGKDEDGNAIEGLSATLVSAAFESDVGLENNPIQPDRTSFTWYEVTAVTEPRDRTLDEVRDRVVAAWKEEERRRLLQERADAIAQEANDRGDLAAVAAANGLQVKTAAGITRVAPASGDLSSSAVATIFDTDRGKAASALGAAPLTSLVLAVDTVTVPAYVADAPDLAQVRQQFDSQFINDLVGMYVSQLQANTEVRFNQPVIQQILGVSPN